MRFIGVTGGVGSGKSSLLDFIKLHYNCKIFLADEVAHTIYEPGNPGYEDMLALFGEDILITDEEQSDFSAGSVDGKRPISKNKVSKYIFSNPEYLQKVNEIVHPAVIQYVMQQYELYKRENNVELFFFEAALLIENGFGNIVDEMWYIYADKATRIKRLMSSRGYTEEKALSIMNKQLSEEEFRSHCDFVLDNSKDLAFSFDQIKQHLEGYTWKE